MNDANIYLYYIPIGIAVLLVGIFTLIYTHFVKTNTEETEKPVLFRIRYSPQKDITAYELAMLPIWIPGFFGCFAWYAEDKGSMSVSSGRDLEIWDNIPLEAKRHFVIEKE